jgi:hypothetical protein
VQRTFMYGDAEATKLTLMKTRRDTDFNRWTVDKATEDVDMRLASAGLGPQPSVVHWKRSPTGSHRNGVFVGKVFDTCAHTPDATLWDVLSLPPFEAGLVQGASAKK